jgi:uncharacterized membrane protein
MTNGTLRSIIGLGTITGMRSLSGPATLAIARGGPLARIASAAAAGEFAADKTSFVGNRTDAIPLAGRVVMGALAGAVVAHEADEAVPAGAVIGAVTAFVSAHAAFYLRRRFGRSVAAGFIEDAVVTAAAAAYLRNRG